MAFFIFPCNRQANMKVMNLSLLQRGYDGDVVLILQTAPPGFPAPDVVIWAASGLNDEVILLLLLQMFMRSPGATAIISCCFLFGAAPIPSVSACAARCFVVCVIAPRASMVIVQVNSSR